MESIRAISVLGFLPWIDPARGIVVQENPAAIVAERVAQLLRSQGFPAHFVPVPVSGDGIRQALAEVVRLESRVVVAVGQTGTEPRVERLGRVPLADGPCLDGEESPWLLAPDAEELVALVNPLSDPAAQLAPFRVSDDAGAYFCDHLCVELVRDMRRRGSFARFLHVTAVDGCTSDVREARLAQYTRQVHAVAERLLRSGTAHALSS